MPTAGTTLQGRYRIVRQLARGGMGTVYEAVDERLDAVVALKETSFGDDELRRQFEREARLLARLHHPALPRVSDHFNEGEGQFLVMQFVEGSDLEALRRERPGGRFSVAEVLEWGDQLLDALDYLHTQQPPVIHRDIKPQNLKLGARGRVMLLDFGLAKGYASRTSPDLPSPSVHGGTLTYSSLEQLEGTGTDALSDLFSLGVTLYQLLTGVLPPTVMTRLNAVHNGQPEPLLPAHEVNPRVSPEVSAVLTRAMSVARDRRPVSADAMRRELREAARQQVGRDTAPTLVDTPARAVSPALVTTPMPHDAAATTETLAEAPTDASASATRAGAQRPAAGRLTRYTPLLVGGLAAFLLLAVAGAVLKLTVFRGTGAAAGDGRHGAAANTGGSNDASDASAPTGGGARSEGEGTGAEGGVSRQLTLKGHEGEVKSVVFSPDGGLVASGGEDRTVRLWDARTGQTLAATSPDLDGGTLPVAFSPDGKMLAVARYYLPATNRCDVVFVEVQGRSLGLIKRGVNVPACPLSVAALSSDGRMLATAASGIELWDAQTGTLKYGLTGHGTVTDSLAFSPDGRTLASAGHVDGAVRLWDVSAGGMRREIKAHEAPTAVAFSPDGRVLATGGYDGALKLWDAGAGAPLKSLAYAPSSVVESIAYSPDGNLLACGGNGGGGEVKVWDARTGELRFDLKAGGVVNCVAFSPDGATLACATTDKTVVLFGLR